LTFRWLVLSNDIYVFICFLIYLNLLNFFFMYFIFRLIGNGLYARDSNIFPYVMPRLWYKIQFVWGFFYISVLTRSYASNYLVCVSLKRIKILIKRSKCSASSTHKPQTHQISTSCLYLMTSTSCAWACLHISAWILRSKFWRVTVFTFSLKYSQKVVSIKLLRTSHQQSASVVS
jgi:ABC-type multidrug transport system fused ATPase/permease subunit